MHMLCTNTILSSKIFLFFVLIFIFLITIFIFIILFIVILVIILQVDNGILFILILSDQITNILIRFLEFHLVHTLTLIPMQESLSLVHFGKLCANALEDTLNGRGVGNKGARNLRSLWRYGNHRRLDIVWNPRHKIIRHLLLNFGHLIINLLCGNLSSVCARSSQIFAILTLHIRQKVSARPHLIRQFLNRQLDFCSLARCKQWSLSQQKEMQSREWDQVDTHFTQITIQFTAESH